MGELEQFIELHVSHYHSYSLILELEQFIELHVSHYHSYSLILELEQFIELHVSHYHSYSLILEFYLYFFFFQFMRQHYGLSKAQAIQLLLKLEGDFLASMLFLEMYSHLLGNIL